MRLLWSTFKRSKIWYWDPFFSYLAHKRCDEVTRVTCFVLWRPEYKHDQVSRVTWSLYLSRATALTYILLSVIKCPESLALALISLSRPSLCLPQVTRVTSACIRHKIMWQCFPYIGKTGWISRDWMTFPSKTGYNNLIVSEGKYNNRDRYFDRWVRGL